MKKQTNLKIITISGRVVRGDGYGKKLGFPTANIDRRQYVRERMNIKLGIWSGQIKILNFKFKIYPAAIVIGPIDKKGLPKIEAHLLNFHGNLYGKKLELSLAKHIRPFKKFKDEQRLKEQIKKDIKKVILLTHNGK